MTDFLASLNSSSSYLSTNSSNIIKSLKTGKDSIESFRTSMLKLENSTHDFIGQFTDFNENIYNFAYAIFSISMFFSVLGLLGIICMFGC